MSDEIQTPPEAPPEDAAGPEGGSQQPDRQDETRPEGNRVVVRYGRMGALAVLRHHLDAPPPPGTQLVVRTGRGTELGQVLVNVGPGPREAFIDTRSLDSYLRANGPDAPVYRGGRVLRLANAQDLNDQQHLQRASGEKAGLCEELIADMKLEMKLVGVEHLLGGERIVFYFSAEHRVDFRELVRRLAGRYHTRIEMRQVGARDEARLVADFERCGRQCCCQTFLKFLKPISMRMAKTQKATLDPTKISGRCGRLMCCLRYEDATYEELIKKLPRKNTWIRTGDGTMGKVVDTQTLTQLVRVMLPDRSHTVISVEEIAELNVPEPTEEDLAAVARKAKPERPLKTAEPAEAAGKSQAPDAARPEGGAEGRDEPAKGKRPGRRRGRRRKKSASAQAPAGAGASGQGGQAPQARGEQPGAKPAKKRRRRRRKKKPRGGGRGGAPAQPA